MKIAYLITAFSNYEHLNKLLLSLDEHGVHFYIHIDKKSVMPEHLVLANKITLVDRVKVYWASWSVQRAITNLMTCAHLGRHDYYVLISGVDYPIRPQFFLYDKLAQGGEYVNIIEGFHSHKPEWRIKYYHFDGYNRRNKKNPKNLFLYSLEVLQRKVKLVSKRKYPFDKVFHGSQWWALSHECVHYVINFIRKNPEYSSFYATSLCSDEGFIHTIIGNSPFREQCKGNLTYTDWSENKSGPAVINKKHVELFSKQTVFEGVYGQYEPFFARKFNDDSGPVVDLIDRKLRQKNKDTHAR